MQETAQEYKQRIFGYLAEQDPVKIQSATSKKLARLVSRASASKLRKQPAPGKWSATEILAHLADVELVVGYRIRTILGAPGCGRRTGVVRGREIPREVRGQKRQEVLFKVRRCRPC